MDELRSLFSILSDSDRIISQAAIRVPGYEQPQPFVVSVNRLRQNQAFLRRRLLQIQRQQAQGPGNMGAVVLVASAIGAGVIGLSAIGGWIYSHFTDAKALDEQTKIYQDMRREGTDAQSAAALVFGGSTDWGSILNKLILLSVIGAGIFVVLRLTK